MAPNAAVSIGEKLGIPVIVKIDDAVYEKSTGLKSIQRKIERTLSSKTLKKSSKINQTCYLLLFVEWLLVFGCSLEGKKLGSTSL